MIAVDTSAVIAILADEDDGPSLARALLAGGRPIIGAATLLECRIVIHNRVGAAGAALLDRFLAELDIEIVDLTAAQAGLAFDAYVRFGRGSGHPARLNFGDCFAYALARSRGVPMLYKGADFAETDIESAV